MKKIVLLLLIFIISFNLVQADMIPEGRKSVDYCFIIENQAEYSKYTFVLYGEPLTHGEIISAGECIGFYKFAQPQIYAIKNSEFDKKELEKMQEIRSVDDNERLKEYFTNNFIASKLKLNVYGLVHKDDPLKSAKDILKIDYLDENQFTISKDQIIYTYEDGTTETKKYSNVNEWPESKQSNGLLLWYFGLPIVALILLIVVFLKRKLR